MRRSAYLVAIVTILAVTATVYAAPLRAAKVGDRMDSLVAGLTKVAGEERIACGEAGPALSYVDYVAPGRPADDDNASFVGLARNGQLILLVAFDEEDLDSPVTVYADLAGKGLVTHMWAVAEAPGPCAIVGRFQPSR